MNAEVLSIGTELLMGQVVNTNAAYLGQELAALGIDLFWVSTVGDNMDRIQSALRQACGRADVVLCTGGLGPTPDDLTSEAVARLIDEPLEIRPDILGRIEEQFTSRHRQTTEMDRKQALFAPSAQIIPNPAGTACGSCVEHDGATILTFPGVPHELEAMWRSWAVPFLQQRSGSTVVSRLLKFAGASEAEIAQQVRDLLDSANPTVAPYTAQYEIHLRLSAKAATRDAADALLDPLEREILTRLGAYYFGRDDQTLAQIVGDRLVLAGQRLCVAESITGGLLASRITDVAGASRYFCGGFVVYTVDQKTGLLGLDPDLLARCGEVSAEVTGQLAQRARARTGADWSVAITGYASSGPDVADQDIGTVYFAIACPDGTLIQDQRRFGRHRRERIKYFASQVALTMLWRQLEQPHSGRVDRPDPRG